MPRLISLSHCTNPTHAQSTGALHSHFLKLNYLADIHLATRLLVAYFKCNLPGHAHQLFEEIASSSPSLDIVSWNSLISGFVQTNRDLDAFNYFKLMQSSRRNLCDSYTLSSLLSSTHCLTSSVCVGKQLHAHSIKSRNYSILSVGNALITYYCAWGQLLNARNVFDEMPQRNVVSWTALISGSSKQGHSDESLRLLILMIRDEEAPWPNQFTFASVFSACASIASLSQGRTFISLALKLGYFHDINVQNSLIGFYAECGCLEEAVATFDGLTEPDIVSWNSLLKGYSQQGRGREALQIFNEMCEGGVRPDSFTLSSVLTACCHSGLTIQGIELFRRMERDYGVKPVPEHVSCVVGLLGRAGRIREAELFIRSMKAQCEMGVSVWRTLLGACRVHGELEVAELAAAEILQVDPSDSEAHVVLSHVYAAHGRWEMVKGLRSLMKDRRVEKEEPGCSWIEVGCVVHSFVAYDWSHPRICETVMRLKELAHHMEVQVGSSVNQELSLATGSS